MQLHRAVTRLTDADRLHYTQSMDFSLIVTTPRHTDRQIHRDTDRHTGIQGRQDQYTAEFSLTN